MIKNMLCNKKVLVVLDGVDELDQLENLAGHGWFGLGSWIIITTRDEHLLHVHGIGEHDRYKPSGLYFHNALKLFCLKAFKKEEPIEGYEQLSRKFLDYANGLPLALAILGSFLAGRTRDEWQSELEKLKKFPERTTFDILKLSYDGLDNMQKKIFLDIACFFKGETKDQVIKILENCNFDAKIDIGVLINKFLVTIENEKLWMHDLLQDMGREIVRQESPEELGEHSRLWLHEDLFNALEKDKATEAIQAIVLNSHKRKVPSMEIEAFAESFSKICNLCSKMRHLRLLIIECVDKKIWDGVTYLRYFPQKKLLELNLESSQIKYFWESLKYLNKLKCIDMRNSYKLFRTPDFTGIPRLETLYLSKCSDLVEIDPSVGRLKRLVNLDLEGCQSLTHLPSLTSEMESLTILNLCGCSKIRKFPEFEGIMKSLSQLNLRYTAIEKLPSSIKFLTDLTVLNLEDCINLECLPSNMDSLRSLEKLLLSRCSKLFQTPDFTGIPRLETLYLSKCSDLVEIDPSVGRLKRLVNLDLEGCQSLTHLPSLTSEMESLTILNLCGCSKIRKFPEFEGIMKSLSQLNLRYTAIEKLPSSIKFLTALTVLNLEDCINLECLPSNMDSLRSLEKLLLSRCPKLFQTPDFTGILRLKTLYLSKCSNLVEIDPSVGQLRRLVDLDLEGCQSLTHLPSLTSEMKSLKILNLCGCLKIRKFPEFKGIMKSLSQLNLRYTAIEKLPSSIKFLTALTVLNLEDCKNLECLPSNMDSLRSLEKLLLSRCSKLANLPENLRKIKCLKQLELSWMSGLEGIGLNGIDYLSSLKHLTLSWNSFVTLPASISKLLKLEVLDLGHCNKLRSLPKLSSTVRYINALHCNSLEPLHESSGGVAFTVLKHYLQELLCRKIGNEPSTKRTKGSGTEFQIIIPGYEIPRWLTHQSLGNSVSIELPPNLCDSRWMGFALCARFTVLDPLTGPFGFDKAIDLKARVKALGDMPDSHYDSEIFFRLTFGSGLWLLYLSRDDWFATVQNGECNQIKVEFETTPVSRPSILKKIHYPGPLGINPMFPRNRNLEVLKCGVRLVYEQDMELINYEGWDGVHHEFDNSARTCDDFKYNDTESAASSSSYEDVSETSEPYLKVPECGVSLGYEQDMEEFNQTNAQCDSSRVITFEGSDGGPHEFDNSARTCYDYKYNDTEPSAFSSSFEEMERFISSLID